MCERASVPAICCLGKDDNVIFLELVPTPTPTTHTSTSHDGPSYDDTVNLTLACPYPDHTLPWPYDTYLDVPAVACDHKSFDGDHGYVGGWACVCVREGWWAWVWSC